MYGSNVKIPTKFLLKSKYYIVLVWICKYCIKFDNELYHQSLNMIAAKTNTAQKMKFSIKDFFSKCDHIRSTLRIRSHLLKRSSMENFIFCAVKVGYSNILILFLIISAPTPPHQNTQTRFYQLWTCIYLPGYSWLVF